MSEKEEKRSPAAERAYPKDLKEAEERLLSRCDGEGSSPPKVGLALSGGGIRSATFGFGVIQALTELKESDKSRLLGKIDILSTVSGGGYIGSLLSRLFARNTNLDEVARVILPARSDSGGTEHKEAGAVLRWLRKNGQYLAPNGSGDLLLSGAIILRNWVSVHVVLSTLALTGFVFMQCVRNLFWDSQETGMQALEKWLTCWLPYGETFLWWSPWLLLPTLIFVLVVVPYGSAYWLVVGCGRQPSTRLGRCLCRYLWWIILSSVILGGSFLLFIYGHHNKGAAPVLAGILAILALLGWLHTLFLVIDAWFCARDADDARVRHRLSVNLKTALVCFGASLSLAFIDTLGQTVYAIWVDSTSSLHRWLGGLISALIVAGVSARRVAAFFSGKGSGERVRLSLDLAAMSIAVLLLTVTLTALNTFSHGIAWGFKSPRHVPKNLVGTGPDSSETFVDINLKYPPHVSENLEAPSLLRGATATISTQDCDTDRSSCPGAKPGERRPKETWGVFVFLAVLSLLFGHYWPLLNNSTLLPLYTARLTRAYLGASNPKRNPNICASNPKCNSNKGMPVAVTQVNEGDDMSIEKRWWKRSNNGNKGDPFKKGAPLHLINVTINATLSSTSLLQHRDRKGMGMAVGPAGISAGVRHHVVFRKGNSSDGITVFPKCANKEDSKGDPPFRMFDYDESKPCFPGRPLSLGQWTGISGAAFSTGLGARTSLGLSLLAGFFNVRLGLWWDSGVKPDKRSGAKKLDRVGLYLSKLLPVPSYLLSEFLSRFHGVNRQWWYLSDGGHFENTGAYELLRRRLPLILIVDAGADPDYTFGDLANLIRKARTDFDAETKFLSHEELGALRRRNPDLARYLKPFGSLEMLRRGPWDTEPLPRTGMARVAERFVFGPPDRLRRSSAHAALAFVYYENNPTPESLIIYIKPTLVGDEPPDITHYHVAHPDFPHQTTADQFFDEAQWESHRMLGYFIAQRMLRHGFTPYFNLLTNAR